MYICFEENSGGIELECGAISDLTLFENLDNAIRWLQERVEMGVKDGFIPERDFGWFDENGKINEAEVRAWLNEEHSVSPTMSLNGNYHNGYYSIVIETKETEDSKYES